MSQPELKYLGIPVFFGGQTWYLPSLSVRQYQQYQSVFTTPIQAELTDGMSDAEKVAAEQDATSRRFVAFVPLIGMALRRNYPQVPDEQLFDDLDLETFPLALRAIQNASGLKAVKPGEV